MCDMFEIVACMKHDEVQMMAVGAPIWFVADRREARERRHKRQVDSRRKRIRCNPRVHFSSAMRYSHQCDMEMYALNLRSKRYAIMIHPSGVCSPIILLPKTTNPRGIIGSFLGGDAKAVAYRDVDDGSRLLVFCINDEVCDDEWDPDAYAILERMEFTMLYSGKIHGNAIVVRLSEDCGTVYIGEVIIMDGIPRTRYCKQVESPPDLS
jgi:hypothetical protein